MISRLYICFVEIEFDIKQLFAFFGSAEREGNAKTVEKIVVSFIQRKNMPDIGAQVYFIRYRIFYSGPVINGKFIAVILTGRSIVANSPESDGHKRHQPAVRHEVIKPLDPVIIKIEIIVFFPVTAYKIISRGGNVAEEPFQTQILREIVACTHPDGIGVV